MDKKWTGRHISKNSLNPYFNGIYFLIFDFLNILKPLRCLNPYFNGIYFLINRLQLWQNSISRSLNPYFNGIYFLIAKNVNI